MNEALNIFFNGIAGVFIGISMLYIAIRLNALACRPRKNKEEES